MSTRTPQSVGHLAASILLVLGVTGCAGHRYAGNMFAVSLEPPPEKTGQPVYLIPDQVWHVYPAEFSASGDLRERDQRLVEYKVESDGTKQVDAITYDVVVKRGDELVIVRQITPSRPGEKFDLTADLRQP